MRDLKSWFFICGVVFMLASPASASIKIKAGYGIGTGSDNTGDIGVWSNYKSVPTKDGTVLGRNPNGVSASIASEGLLFGSRLTYDQTSTGNKSGDLTMNNSTKATITTQLMTNQYGLDFYVRTPTPFISIYGGVGAMYIQANLHEEFSYVNGSGYTSGGFDATANTVGYRAFAGIDYSFAFLLGLSLEVFQNVAQIDEFTLSSSYDASSGSGLSMVSGQPLKKYNKTAGSLSEDLVSASLNATGIKLSLYLDF